MNNQNSENLSHLETFHEYLHLQKDLLENLQPGGVPLPPILLVWLLPDAHIHQASLGFLEETLSFGGVGLRGSSELHPLLTCLHFSLLLVYMLVSLLLELPLELLDLLLGVVLGHRPQIQPAALVRVVFQGHLPELLAQILFNLIPPHKVVDFGLRRPHQLLFVLLVRLGVLEHFVEVGFLPSGFFSIEVLLVLNQMIDRGLSASLLALEPFGPQTRPLLASISGLIPGAIGLLVLTDSCGVPVAV